ncbi:MAG: scpA [Candidatus Kaiserbacteria bacterium]|nr:scpA [Candidatus Kaiserbacteria bacterium]
MTSDFSIATESYQGPLETLLNLIEVRKMSVSDISLVEVCDAYLSYVEQLPALPMGETAQFVLIASTLLLIKSRSLLPTLEITEDENASIQDLESRLKLYAATREASKVLRARWGKAPFLLAQRPPARPVVFAPGVEGEATPSRLSTMLQALLHSIPVPEKLMQATVAPVLALEDVILHVRNRLSMALKTRFSDLTRGAGDKHEVIVYFLAVLELVRGGSASATQDKLFSDITIEMEGLITTPKYL